MSWIVLKLLGVGRWLWDLARAIGRWVLADWRNGPLLVFVLAFAAHVLVIVPGLREDLRQSEAALKATSEAFDQTVKDYQEAVTAARLAAEMNVARVETEQAEITQEIVDDYENRLAEARARAARIYGAGGLRGTAPAGAAGSGAGAAGVPGLSAAPGRTGPATGENRLPAPGATAGELTPPDALVATEQALQLQALIEWVNRQAAVEVVPSAEIAEDLK